MLKSKSKKLAATFCAVALVVTCSISALAAPQDWSVNFPRFNGETDIISDTKESTYASVKYVDVGLKDISQYARSGDFVIRADLNGWTNVSGYSTVYAGKSVRIPLNNSQATQGTTLMLVGKNHQTSIYYVAAEGTVDFH